MRLTLKCSATKIIPWPTFCHFCHPSIRPPWVVKRGLRPLLHGTCDKISIQSPETVKFDLFCCHCFTYHSIRVSPVASAPGPSYSPVQVGPVRVGSVPPAATEMAVRFRTSCRVTLGVGGLQRVRQPEEKEYRQERHAIHDTVPG